MPASPASEHFYFVETDKFGRIASKYTNEFVLCVSCGTSARVAHIANGYFCSCDHMCNGLSLSSTPDGALSEYVEWMVKFEASLATQTEEVVVRLTRLIEQYSDVRR